MSDRLMYSSLSSSDSQTRRAADVEEQPLQRARALRSRARFMNASSSMTVPNSMPKNPAASTMCGGLMILHVEAVGVVPPVVERRRREHRDAAPGRDERAERPRQPQMRTLDVAQRARSGRTSS